MNARRGFVPEDEVNFSPEAVIKMRTGSRHILYLLNEGYDLKSASTFVGNHFLFSERQRLALTRSLAADGDLILRENKRKAPECLSGREVWIDGFNQIITAEVMLSRSLLFLGMDGCIRDLAALRGTYRIIPETKDAVKLILETLAEMKVRKANILLDEPVSNSGRLKTLIAETGESLPLELDIQIAKDVDRLLYDKDNVITSDSIILDHCIGWVNLMEACIKKSGMIPLKVWEQPKKAD